MAYRNRSRFRMCPAVFIRRYIYKKKKLENSIVFFPLFFFRPDNETRSVVNRRNVRYLRDNISLLLLLIIYCVITILRVVRSAVGPPACPRE